MESCPPRMAYKPRLLDHIRVSPLDYMLEWQGVEGQGMVFSCQSGRVETDEEWNEFVTTSIDFFFRSILKRE